MPITPDERSRRVDALRNQLNKFATFDVDRLVRPELGGPLGFEPLRPTLESIVQIAKQLLGLPLELLPQRLVDMVSGAFGQMEPCFNALIEFDIDRLNQQQQNIIQVRERRIAEVDKAEPQFWDSIAPVVGFLTGIRLERDPELSGASARQLLAGANTALQEALTHRDEIVRVLEASRKAAGEIGVTQHATHFLSEADTHRESARRWLATTVILASLTVVVVAANLLEGIPSHRNTLLS